MCVLFSQLLFTVFFLFRSKNFLSLRVVHVVVVFRRTTNEAKIFLSLPVCVLVCVLLLCCYGELTNAANISEFTRILYTFSSFKTVSNRAAANLLLPLPLIFFFFSSFVSGENRWAHPPSG